MKKIYIPVLLCLLAFGCDWKGENPSSFENIIINNDSQQLSQRISRDGSGVVSITASQQLNARINGEDAPAGKYPIVMVAQVDGPSYNGKNLRATHVDIADGYAYVSYNKEGADFLGAIEIYDISKPSNPQITSQAIFTTADINALKYKNGKLHIAAAFNVDAEPNMESAAQYISVSVNNGQFTSEFTKVDIHGAAGTGIDLTDNHIAVTSGANGRLSLIDFQQNTISQKDIEDLRDVSFGENVLATLSGTDGIRLHSAETLNILSQIALDKDIPASKRTMDIGNKMLFVSEGKNGAGVYSLPNGSLIKNIDILSNPETVDPNEIVTNAVSFNENLLLMANGSAGVEVVEFEGNSSIETLGLLTLDGSANFVKLVGNNLFVATGKGGLQILEIERSIAEPSPGINCENTVPFVGSNNLNINSNEVKRYSGSASIHNMNVGGSLLFCGSMAVQNSLNINSNGLFEMSGSFSFGRFDRNDRIHVNSNAVFRINGSAVIYGDLTLNSGGTLEFVGEGSSITVYGKVTINNGAQVIGKFTDTEGKFK